MIERWDSKLMLLTVRLVFTFVAVMVGLAFVADGIIPRPHRPYIALTISVVAASLLALTQKTATASAMDATNTGEVPTKKDIDSSKSTNLGKRALTSLRSARTNMLKKIGPCLSSWRERFWRN